MAYCKTHKKDYSKDENYLQLNGRHSYEDEINGKKSETENEDHNQSFSSFDDYSKRLSLPYMSFTPFFDRLVIDIKNEDIEQKMDDMFFEEDGIKQNQLYQRKYKRGGKQFQITLWIIDNKHNNVFFSYFNQIFRYYCRTFLNDVIDMTVLV